MKGHKKMNMKMRIQNKNKKTNSNEKKQTNKLNNASCGK
jgi:hypothetical protein